MSWDVNFGLLDPQGVGRVFDSYQEGVDNRNKNALANMALKKAQQEQADDDAYRSAWKDAGGNYDALENNLARLGLGKQLMDLRKQRLETEAKRTEIDKNKATTGKTNIEATDLRFKQYKDRLAGIETPEAAAAWMRAGYEDPVISQLTKLTGVPLEQAIGNIPSEPAAFKEWKIRNTLGMEKLLPVIQTRNMGGTTDTLAIDPVTGKVNVTSSVQNTQSPDSVASNQLGYARLGEERRHNRETEAAPVFNESAGGFVVKPTASNPNGAVLPVAGLQGGKLTEDQGKATGWLVQADNAWRNMQGVTAKNPDAAKPGFNDAIATIPGMGWMANSLRSSDRQSFMQGASSLSEALLRAATGAGVNRDEAAQKIREITPVFGDSDATIKQKMDAIPLYLESLKVRAGPGAGRAANISATATNNRPAVSAPARIASDADYNALPPGSLFVGPDGKTRRKP